MTLIVEKFLENETYQKKKNQETKSSSRKKSDLPYREHSCPRSTDKDWPAATQETDPPPTGSEIRREGGTCLLILGLLIP